MDERLQICNVDAENSPPMPSQSEKHTQILVFFFWAVASTVTGNRGTCLSHIFLVLSGGGIPALQVSVAVKSCSDFPKLRFR